MDSDPQRGAGTGRGVSAPLLELTGVTKRFPGVTALTGVDFAVAPGEIHALVGENGAGKSTLIKLLCGTYAADAGQMRFGGAPYRPQSPLEALEAGIRVVYQEFNLLPYLSVAENLFFDHLPRRYGLLLDRRSLDERSAALLRRVGLEVDPRTRVEYLGVAQCQLLEIAKALSSAGRLLILDEPTATLTPREIARLFEIIRGVRRAGVAVIYVSHHLNEIFDLCDRVTILRNGQRIASLVVAETTPQEVVHHMVGRELELELARASGRAQAKMAGGAAALRVRDLRFRGNPHGVTFEVRYGEIVGFAGLVGSGRTETLRAIFGADRRDGGEIYREGRRMTFDGPKDAVRHGVCLLTENRKEQGLVLDMPARVNVTLTDLRRVARAGVLRPGVEKGIAQGWVDELHVRLASLEQLVRDLSGGNQQKIVIAKWLYRNAAVLMLDEPTRGIDVGAKAEIHELLRRLAAQGKAIIVVSSEIPELIALCDRILVLWRGRIAGEVQRHEFDNERILSLACGESYDKDADVAARRRDEEGPSDE
ncbi:MAG: sugar ABC transporter ATP-binding protein [Verrucomicrobia bacterium]|nr:sugar ABC transporter ATP-binding protein [Verrucomicrobiota bacterium]